MKKPVFNLLDKFFAFPFLYFWHLVPLLDRKNSFLYTDNQHEFQAQPYKNSVRSVLPQYLWKYITYRNQSKNSLHDIEGKWQRMPFDHRAHLQNLKWHPTICCTYFQWKGFSFGFPKIPTFWKSIDFLLKHWTPNL